MPKITIAVHPFFRQCLQEEVLASLQTDTLRVMLGKNKMRGPGFVSVSK